MIKEDTPQMKVYQRLLLIGVIKRAEHLRPKETREPIDKLQSEIQEIKAKYPEEFI